MHSTGTRRLREERDKSRPVLFFKARLMELLGCTGFRIWTPDSLRGSRIGLNRTHNSVGQTAVLLIGTVERGSVITA